MVAVFRTLMAIGLGAGILAAAACSPRDGSGASTPRPTRAGTSTPSPTATRPIPTATQTPVATPVPDTGTAWEPCGDDSEFECAVLVVPLDYSGKTPGEVEFGVLRWPASDPATRIGALLVDPGGPGGSGTAMVQWLGGPHWDELHQHFDIIGFDPRGVGPDGDVVDCVENLDNYFQVATPYTPAERETLVRVAAAFAAACDQRAHGLLPFLSAESVARDMDQIRIALGEERISYFGFSYGTYLGAYYAELFPERIRAMVLDGAVAPSLTAKEFQLQQAVGFETAFDAFVEACDLDPECPLASFPGGAAGAYDSLMASLQERPLAVGGRHLGRSEAENAVLGSLYSRDAWSWMAADLADALDGDGEALLYDFDAFAGRDYDGSYDGFQETYRAIECVDLAFPRTVEEFDAWAADFAAAAPRFGRMLAYEHIDCAWWAVPPVPPLTISGAGAPPLLVVGTTRDPATPLRWAVALASQLESGMLLEVDGDGHTAYSQNTCAAELINAYLVSLDAGGDGESCPSEAPEGG